MKNKRHSKEKRKSSRVLAVLMALMMITALILPIGAKASETSDGSASGASQAVAEEYTKKEEEKDSSHCDAEKEEEKEKTDSAENQEKEQKSDSSADASLEDSADSKTESKDSEAKDSGSKDTESKVESSDSDQTSGKNASNKDASNKETSNVEGGKGAEKDSIADQKDSGNTDASKDEEDKTDAASPAKDTSSGKSGQAEISEETAEQVTAEQKDDDTTITFRTEEVTVIADKKAFDTEVTMKVKKVTDPEQLLKMVTALQEEGGSYTVKAYNVSFYDKKGKEVEPKIPVQVNVNTKVSAPKKTKVVHVKDDDKTEILDADIDRSGASFELGSFSDIGVATEGKAKIPGSSFDIYLGDELTTEYTVEDLPAGPISEKDLPAVDGYTYENATVGDDQVEELGTITDEDGNVYVYYTTKDENGTIKAEILGNGRIRINLVETEKDTVYDLDADGAHVHVEAPADAFDEGTYMEISGVELTDAQQTQVQAQAAEKLGEDAELNIQAVDITFYDKDNHKVQPEKPVRVELTTPQAVEGNFCVVHLGDDDTADRVEASRSDEGTICFTAERFSVYAVVGDNLLLGESRMTLNFYNGDELIGTMYVKNDDDTPEELEQIIYDPGAGTLEAGELFKGWIEKADYEVEDAANKMDIAAIRAWAKKKANDNSIEEGEEHNFYAMIFKTFSVVFKDEDGATIHSEALIFKSSDGSVDYTINQPYTPKDQDEAFRGWYWQPSDPDSTVSDGVVAKDGSVQPFPNETEVTIKDNITFTVNVPRGYWLSFMENGEGASYTPPQFIQTGEKPQEPNEPKRFGYQFGGWYENPQCEGQPFDFDQELSGRTILYAKWTPNPTANYMVIVWVENIDGDGYDFAAIQTLSGPVNSPTSACLTTSQSGDAEFATIQGTTSEGTTVNETYNHSWTNESGNTTFKGFTFKEYTTNNEDTINANGTSVINVYYDRLEYTLKFYYARSQTTGGTPVYERINLGTANNGTIPGVSGVQGNYYYTSETGNTRVYWRNGYFRTTDRNNGPTYNGSVWERIQTGTSGGTTSYEVSTVGSREETAEAHDGTGGSWQGPGTAQPGSSYGGAGTETRGNYTYYYRTLTAKYGTFIGDKWPTYNWIDFEYWRSGNTNYRQNSWAVMRNSQAYQSQPANNRQGTIKGKITIMDEQILGDLTQINGNYVYANYDRENATYQWTYHIYFENETGDGYSWYEDVGALSHDSGQYWQTQQKPPAYPGMDNDNVSKELTTGNYNDRQINYYYDRLKYPIVFMDGQYVNGNGVGIHDHSANSLKQTDPILYGASVASYNEGQSNYYEPKKGDDGAYPGFDPTGFVFGGWYTDAGCTIPYTFSKMPLDGITVYAKWVQKEYRVFLHPNVPIDDTSLDFGGQSTSFRVASGEKIAGGNTIQGTRDEYDLIGWYTDEACTKAFNFDAYVLNDSTVTEDYDKTEDTELDKYGNTKPGESGNKDATENRFWIDRKLDLYAKWRARLDGANGINVIYDAGDGTNPPQDHLEYLDNSGATAGAASTPNDTVNKQFMHWVVQTWNGTAYVDTGEIVYPGDIFTVLKANSKVLVTEWVNPEDVTDVITVENPSPGTTSPDSTHTKIQTASYTVQLRAEYGDKEAPTPTHIWWFPNNVEAGTMHNAVRADEGLQINEAVNIETPPTRSGYTFLGWAKVESSTSGSSRVGTATPTAKGVNLTEDNLFLKYENGGFKAEIDGVWTTVTQVAADEQDPYHDLYAVWEKSAVDIVVNKVVTGNMGDTSKDFTFEAAMADGSAFAEQEDSKVTLKDENKTASFSLKDGESVTITGLPSTASMTITETNAGDYDTSADGISEGTLAGKTYSFTVPDEDGEVTFTNDKTVVAPTQLYSGTGPMAVLVVFSLGALILLAAHHFIDRFRNSNSF